MILSLVSEVSNCDTIYLWKYRATDRSFFLILIYNDIIDRINTNIRNKIVKI